MKNIANGIEAIAYAVLKMIGGFLILSIILGAFMNGGFFLGITAVCICALIYNAIVKGVKHNLNKIDFYANNAKQQQSPQVIVVNHQSDSLNGDSPYKIVIKASKSLEAKLSQLGATGKGIHEKVSSIESTLPRELISYLRRVATIRNKLIHEDGFELSDRDLRRFETYADEASEELDELIERSEIIKGGNDDFSNLDLSPVKNTHENTMNDSIIECKSCHYIGKTDDVYDDNTLRFSCCSRCSEILVFH
jgi:hypothetical protein